MGNVVSIVVDSNVPSFSPGITQWGTSWSSMNISQQNAWTYISTHGTKIYDGPDNPNTPNGRYITYFITSPGTLRFAYYKLDSINVGFVFAVTQDLTRYVARSAERDYDGYMIYTETLLVSSNPTVNTYRSWIEGIPSSFIPFDTQQDAIDAVMSIYPVKYPITYRLTNSTAPSAPIEAAVGDTVTVPFQFPSGYGLVNPSSDVYVTNNGVIVPSQYSNGTLTFTMPDPT